MKKIKPDVTEQTVLKVREIFADAGYEQVPEYIQELVDNPEKCSWEPNTDVERNEKILAIASTDAQLIFKTIFEIHQRTLVYVPPSMRSESSAGKAIKALHEYGFDLIEGQIRDQLKIRVEEDRLGIRKGWQIVVRPLEPSLSIKTPRSEKTGEREISIAEVKRVYFSAYNVLTFPIGKKRVVLAYAGEVFEELNDAFNSLAKIMAGEVGLNMEEIWSWPDETSCSSPEFLTCWEAAQDTAVRAIQYVAGRQAGS